MTLSSRRGLCLAVFALSVLGSIRAQTTVSLFHAGESDGGAANGATLASTTINSSTGPNLTLSGTGTYSSAAAPGSSLAFNFTSGGGYVGATNTSLTNSQGFAMEIWFNAASLTGGALFYNGDTGGSGVGLFIASGHLAVLAGGAIFDSGATNLNTGVWYHAALVNDAGALRLYLNGTQDYIGGNGFNNPSGGGLSIGSNNGSGDRFNGRLDEARIFTFASGTFNPSMLSYSAIPEPSTYAAIFGAGVLGIAFWRRRRGHQHHHS